MKISIALRGLAVSVLGLGLSTAHAATIWDEAQNGDLSNDGLSPTALIVSNGSNQVLGTTGTTSNGIDRDYFKFTVPAGATLSAIQLLGNTAVSGSVSFIALQGGPQLTVTPTGGGVEQLLALGHYGNDQIGTDLLPTIKLGPPGPLPSGTYSVWVQDTGGPASYGFDFVISPPAAAKVPSLPGRGLLVLGVLLGLVFWFESSRASPLRRLSRIRSSLG
jgi:hypothetical protein